MTAEKAISPEQLIGKSVIELISVLPSFNWYVQTVRQRVRVDLSSLTLVDYDTFKPRTEIDLYPKVYSNPPGSAIPKEELVRHLTPPHGRSQGLSSLVFVDPRKYEEGEYGSLKKPWAHIPLIDMDLDEDFPPGEAVPLIKKELAKTEVGGGVLLSSGRKNHFHFIGTERLFTEEQLPTFVGLCLTMFYSDKKQLVDPKWAAHILSPLKYLAKPQPESGKSAYDFDRRFATLRISTSEKKPNMPEVIDYIKIHQPNSFASW